MYRKKARGVPRTLRKTSKKCSCCGVIYETDSFNEKMPLPQMMAKRKICFECAFWIHKIENPLQHREIINGEHYVFKPVQEEKPYFQGYGGHEFYAIHNDGTIVTSNNVWYQGVIPERFRKRLPNTAKFISKTTFRKLNSNPFICKSAGCWDRYHCLRYDNSIEKQSGPWNQVPKTHKPGEEGCESFINKENA